MTSIRMPHFLLPFVLLCVTAAQSGNTDLSFVSCWSKDSASYPVSRFVKSEVVTSRSYWRAYATVKANAYDGSCQNATNLYVASPAGAFVRVFRQLPLATQDGNGIRILGWSPSGAKLLAEVTDWAYGSDAGPNRAVLIYDSHGIQKPDLGASLEKRFDKHCLFDYSVIGWQSESTIILHVRPFREVLDDRPSCVDQPTSFVYQMERGALQPL